MQIKNKMPTKASMWQKKRYKADCSDGNTNTASRTAEPRSQCMLSARHMEGRRERETEREDIEKIATPGRAKDKKWAFFYLLIYVKGTV